MICNDPACGCAISSTTLTISGSGTPEDPWVIEQIEFSDLTALQNAVANLEAAMNLLPGTYVDQAGDQMTGPLTIDVSGSDVSLTLKQAGDNPFVALHRQDGTRIGYLQARSGDGQLRLVTESGVDLLLLVDGTERMRITTGAGNVLIGKSGSDIALPGLEFLPGGSARVSRSTVGNNFHSNKTSTADVNGAVHALFTSAGTTIGSITRATASTVAFNTSSDEDLKQNVEPLDDELALYWLRVVQPMLFEYIRTPGNQHVGYIAQRIAAAWPESIALGIVTPGHGDVNARTWDDDGNETTPDDVWQAWQIDLSKFTPFVHAGLRAVDVRLSIVEDIVAEHSAKIIDLETRVTQNTADLAALDRIVKGLGKK